MAQPSAALQAPETARPISKRVQCRAKCCKRLRGSYLPVPEQRRIQSQFIAGSSVRKISRETGHHQATIARVVRAEEVQEYVKQLRLRLLAVGDDAVERVRSEIISGRQGGWLAFELLKGIGVFLQQTPNQEPAATTPSSEEDEIRKIAVALVDGALRRQKFFGLPVPELDEVEESRRISG